MSDFLTPDENCNCPRGSYLIKHAAGCYERRISKLNLDLLAALGQQDELDKRLKTLGCQCGEFPYKSKGIECRKCFEAKQQQSANAEYTPGQIAADYVAALVKRIAELTEQNEFLGRRVREYQRQFSETPSARVMQILREHLDCLRVEYDAQTIESRKLRCLGEIHELNNLLQKLESGSSPPTSAVETPKPHVAVSNNGTTTISSQKAMEIVRKHSASTKNDRSSPDNPVPPVRAMDVERSPSVPTENVRSTISKALGTHPSHKARFSDASTYDEVCDSCGATDATFEGENALAAPCKATSQPTNNVHAQSFDEWWASEGKIESRGLSTKELARLAFDRAIYEPSPSPADRYHPEGQPWDLIAHLYRQRAFSEQSFGPGVRTAGVCDHIRKELMEVEAKPHDLSEWVDVILLALDGAWRAGYLPGEIVAAIDAKQTKNENRKWPDWRTADPNKAIEHDRTADETVCPTLIQFN
jgi:hypothetical protein